MIFLKWCLKLNFLNSVGKRIFYRSIRENIKRENSVRRFEYCLIKYQSVITKP